GTPRRAALCRRVIVGVQALACRASQNSGFFGEAGVLALLRPTSNPRILRSPSTTPGAIVMRLSTRLLFVAFSFFIAFSASAAEPFLEKIDLFKAGDDGYALYHIPGIVVTAKGTVLAWCEARRVKSDWDMIDILLRRSEDGGRTWSKAEKVAD